MSLRAGLGRSPVGAPLPPLLKVQVMLPTHGARWGVEETGKERAGQRPGPALLAQRGARVVFAGSFSSPSCLPGPGIQHPLARPKPLLAAAGTRVQARPISVRGSEPGVSGSLLRSSARG